MTTKNDRPVEVDDLDRAGDTAGPRVSRPGHYSGYGEATYDGWERSSEYVTMRDGVRLAVDIIRPARGDRLHDGPLPVLWSHTPYTRAVVDPAGTVLPAPIEGWAKMLPLVAYGYVIGLVDARGHGASFGQAHALFNPAESDDAYEITEWFASQPYCDGAVGMWGRSYLGITQLMCASRQPPSLKAVFPEMGFWDAYGALHPGGVFRIDMATMWDAGVRALDLGLPMMVEDVQGQPQVNHPAAPVDADDGTDLLEARRHHQTNTNVYAFVRDHNLRDSVDEFGERVWEARSPADQRERIEGSGVAIYHYGGWFDGFTRDAVLAFAHLSNPQKLLIDPNYHSDYHGFDLPAEQRRWFDFWLKGIDNGIMDEPAVTYWLLGADGDPWRRSPSWPVPGVETSTLFLAAGPSGTVASDNDGTLAEQPADSGVDHYQIDYSTTAGPANRWANVYGGPGRTNDFDAGPHLGYPDLADNDVNGLTFTGEPLLTDIELVGHPVIHLWITATEDVNVFAYLEEVRPDGFSRYLSEGCLRLSHRAVEEAPFEYLDMPWHPSRTSTLLPPFDGPMELAFDLQPIGTVIRAGSRVRVTLTGADRAVHELREMDPPPAIGVLRGGEHPSRIELPARRAEVARA